MRLVTTTLLAALLAMPIPGQAADAPEAVALLPLELEDTSGEGPRADQERRLRMLDAELRGRLAQSGRYVPLTAALPADTPSLRGCDRCDIAAAEQVAAGLVMTGMVHKISNLILTLTLVLREVPSGEIRGAWRADLRGNTDESWLRALRWLLRNRVLTDQPQP